MKNLSFTTNRSLLRHLGRLLGPILPLMPFPMGGSFLVVGKDTLADPKNPRIRPIELVVAPDTG